MVEIREWDAGDAASRFRRPTPDDHKYSRGVLGIRTGSQEYPGAAVLGVEAAWRTGLGMVRYLGAERPSDLVMRRRPETVMLPGRVQAWLVGSGTDAATRPAAETARIIDILAGDLPVVVDAGALDLVPGATAPLVLTPHDREHARLRELLGLSAPGDDRVGDARETARSAGCTVLLKGAETIAVGPGGRALVVRRGSGWLATAGTGDVLAGVVGAVIAANAVVGPPAADELVALAATGAWVHGAASRVGADRPLVALDLAEAVSDVVGDLLDPSIRGTRPDDRRSDDGMS